LWPAGATIFTKRFWQANLLSRQNKATKEFFTLIFTAAHHSTSTIRTVVVTIEEKTTCPCNNTATATEQQQTLTWLGYKDKNRKTQQPMSR
jgi:hypothetical protein